jgi:putative membrane protein
MGRLSRGQSLLCWCCAAIALGGAVVGTALAGWNPLVLFVATFPVAVVLSLHRHGWRGAAAFWVASLLISNAIENLSIVTGFPFGHYHYTGAGKIFLVPAFIGPVYASLGYISWTIANYLLGEADRRIAESGNVFILPLIAGMVMTMWDVASDPQASTIGRSWIWEQGGAYFGVPESNFLGWWLTTYLFFQVFAVYIWRTRRPLPSELTGAAMCVPVILYFSYGCSIIMDWLTRNSGIVRDATGDTWHEQHIVGTMAIVAVFTMMFALILTVHRIREARHAQAERNQKVDTHSV